MAQVKGTIVEWYPLKNGGEGTTVIQTEHGTVLEGTEVSQNPLTGEATIEF